MNFKFYISTVSFLLCSCVCIAQPSKKSPGSSFKIQFVNVVDNQTMHLGSTYKNSFGEEYTLKTFKYYISNISLLTTGNKNISYKKSYLINEADSNSRSIVLQTPKASVKQISFMIGVDSIYNVSGTQTGDLDPMRGMLWTWNSGYIMAKLEATSPASTLQDHKVEFHIGGFKGSQKTQRKVVLILDEDNSNTIVIEANANKWFDAEHALKIAINPACTTPGKLAAEFADNYSRMFKIVSIK